MFVVKTLDDRALIPHAEERFRLLEVLLLVSQLDGGVTVLLTTSSGVPRGL